MEPEDQDRPMDTNTPEEQPNGVPPQDDNGTGDEGQNDQNDQEDQGVDQENQENSEEE